jgi:uncharacterized protein YjbJ (UPF0337 family)
MSLTDKLTGRIKKAAGDLTGDRDLHREGAREERKADAKEELDRQHEALVRKAEEVQRLERDS